MWIVGATCITIFFSLIAGFFLGHLSMYVIALCSFALGMVGLRKYMKKKQSEITSYCTKRLEELTPNDTVVMQCFLHATVKSLSDMVSCESTPIAQTEAAARKKLKELVGHAAHLEEEVRKTPDGIFRTQLISAFERTQQHVTRARACVEELEAVRMKLLAGVMQIEARIASELGATRGYELLRRTQKLGIEIDDLEDVTATVIAETSQAVFGACRRIVGIAMCSRNELLIDGAARVELSDADDTIAFLEDAVHRMHVPEDVFAS
jgi:hypothetical protein